MTAPTIGVDAGGTKVAAALVAEDGRILRRARRDASAAEGGDAVVDAMVAAAREVTAGTTAAPAALGVGVAAQVDEVAGVVRQAPNLPLDGVPLKARLADALKMPVVVTNDVRAITFGEWRMGAGRGVDDLVCVYVGTGIGGGVVSGGRLLHGARGTAGEVGHVPIHEGGRPCRCQSRGCVEAYAGGWAVAERAREAAAADPAGAGRVIALAGDLASVDAVHVTRAAREGDDFAVAFLERVGHDLGAGLVTVVNVLNPARLVLGGGMLDGWPRLAEVANDHVRTWALPAATDGLTVVRSELGADAGVVGAALLARESPP